MNFEAWWIEQGQERWAQGLSFEQIARAAWNAADAAQKEKDAQIAQQFDEKQGEIYGYEIAEKIRAGE